MSRLRRKQRVGGLSRAQVDALLAAAAGEIQVAEPTARVLIGLGYLERGDSGSWLVITERGRGAAAVLGSLSTRRTTDKAALSVVKPYRETPHVTDAVCRLILAIGKRVAEEDTDGLEQLQRLDEAIADAWKLAITGLRRNYSDTQIGNRLRVKKQAVQQRWPRAGGAEKGDDR